MIVLLLGKCITFFDLFSKLVAHIFLLLFGEFSKFLVSLDLFFNLFVLLLNHINLGVNLVNVVIQRIILLIGLDEGGDNFLNGSNTCLLLNLSESVLNDIDISNIHIHQVLFLFVIVCPLLQSQLQQGSWVRELTTGGGGGVDRPGSSLGFGLLEFSVILLPQLLL